MFYSDSHIHTNYSADVPADRPLSVDDICRTAIRAGLSYIAFTDHYEPEEEKRGVVPPFPFANMVRDVLAAKETYRDQLKVALGIEYGQPYLYPDEIQPTVSAYPYDVILGSVHYIPGQTGYISRNWRELTKAERDAIFDEYLDTYNLLVHTDGIDVVTHPTYPLRYLLRQNIPFDMRDWEERLRAMFRVLVQRGIGLEFNASPMRVPNQGIPDHTVETFFRWYRDEGGEIVTFASDAHFTAHVGAYCDRTMRILREIGFRYIAVYENRKPVFHKIELP